MAKKQNSLDYNAEVKALKECPPKRLYLLSGEEDYLRDRYHFRCRYRTWYGTLSGKPADDSTSIHAC